jgi:hypothetical protein
MTNGHSFTSRTELPGAYRWRSTKAFRPACARVMTVQRNAANGPDEPHREEACKMTFDVYARLGQRIRRSHDPP